jgi:hypothetical protein
LAEFSRRLVCSCRRKIAVRRLVGAYAFEDAHAVMQRVGEHVDGGVAPVDELAIHPDLAVAVGH